MTATSEMDIPQPTHDAAMAAVRCLLHWIGEDPAREGLRETPSRVVKAYREMFSGYEVDVGELLSTSFREVAGFKGLVSLNDIPFVSHCEHHLLPFYGLVHVSYIPTDRVVGISKISRLVEAFARRVQIQERLTANIASALSEYLAPTGVAVAIDAVHMCMVARGVQKLGSVLRTISLNGAFAGPDSGECRQFLSTLPDIRR